MTLPGCEGPSGLAYDARSHWLISACANGKAAVIDATTRHEIALLDIGMGPDAVILDADRRLAFVPCGKSGTLVAILVERCQTEGCGDGANRLKRKDGRNRTSNRYDLPNDCAVFATGYPGRAPGCSERPLQRYGREAGRLICRLMIISVNAIQGAGAVSLMRTALQTMHVGLWHDASLASDCHSAKAADRRTL